MLDVKKREFGNGLKCYIVNKPEFAEKKAMVAFNYGSCDDEFIYDGALIYQPMGIAHFLEHKLFEDKERDNFACFTELGAAANAYTNFTTTAYHFSTGSNFYECFKLLLEMVSSLYLTEENIKKEKGIIAQEINMYKDDPMWALYFNTLSAAYSSNSVRNSVAGTIESVNSITKAELELSYKSFYTFDNACVIVMGNVDEDKIYKEIEHSLKLGGFCASKTMVEDSIACRKVIDDMTIDKSLFSIGYREYISTEDIALRSCVNEILMEILCSGGSKLNSELISDGIIDMPLGYEYLCGRDYGMRMINGVGNSAERVAEAVEREINSHLHYGIKQSEIDTAVEALKGKLDMMEDNINSSVMYIADCFSKGIETLDIYQKYDKIREEDLLIAMADLNNRVISVINSDT